MDSFTKNIIVKVGFGLITIELWATTATTQSRACWTFSSTTFWCVSAVKSGVSFTFKFELVFIVIKILQFVFIEQIFVVVLLVDLFVKIVQSFHVQTSTQFLKVFVDLNKFILDIHILKSFGLTFLVYDPGYNDDIRSKYFWKQLFVFFEQFYRAVKI